MTRSFSSSSFHQLPSPPSHGIDSGSSTRHTPLDSHADLTIATTGFTFGLPDVNVDPVLNMIGMHDALAEVATINAQRAKLSLLTDVGRRYPGYPSPLSPTCDAKQVFPSPPSETDNGIATPRPGSPVRRMASPMSIDGSEMCDPSRRCMSHGLDFYATMMNLKGGLDTPNSKAGFNGLAFVPEAKIGSLGNPTQLLSPPRSPTMSSPDETSPPCALSPRTAMLKNLVGKEALQSLSHQPCPSATTSPPVAWPHIMSPNPPSSVSSSTSPPLAVPIANGLETSTTSPLSRSGTMLSYTSNRSVDSGLLAVRPLSEVQVAEYRFWRPCGRRTCAFGCGASGEGEMAAAKRLFRDEQEVKPEVEEERVCATEGIQV